MSFAVFLLYIFLSFFRPIELFAPDLGEYRPMLVLWVIAFVMAGARAVSRKEMACRPVHIGLLVALCISIAASQVLIGWAGGAVQALSEFSPSVMLFVLIVLNITSLQRLKSTCVVLVVSMVLVSGFSIRAYHTGEHAEELVLRQNTSAHDAYEGMSTSEARSAAEVIPAQDKSGWFLWRIRGLGFLSDPNDLAQVLVLTLPLLWGAWRKGQRLHNLVQVIVPGSVIGYAMVLTQSRGSIIGVAAMLFFGVRKILGTTKTAVLIGLMVLVVVAGNMAGGRGFSSKERSAEERIEAWEVGIKLVRQYPITGAGYGNFTDHNPLTAHNSYVLCFAELGLVGYFLWLGLIVLTYKGLSTAVERLPEHSEERKVTGLIRSALVGFLACAWFLSRTYAPGLYFVLGLSVASWWIAKQSIADQIRISDLALQGDQDPIKREATQSRLAPLKTGVAELGSVAWRKSTLLAMTISMSAVYGFIVMHRLSGG